jgi:signal transduction histidine kinase/ActR/RegA family two-component response regulator
MPLRKMALRRKLMFNTMATSGIALLLTCSGFFAYDVLTFRQTTARELSTTAAIIANNCTAVLAFDDRTGAGEILAALKAEPHVEAAALYDGQGRIFSRYPDSKAESAFPPAPAADGFRFEPGFLTVLKPVIQNDNRLGTLYVKANLKAQGQRFSLYGGVAVVVAAISFILAYLLTRKLQQQITTPILSLAETAKAVSDRRDYSVRARQVGSHELEVLTNAFNHMLTHIQEQMSRMELLNRITRAIGERLDLPSIFQVMVLTLEDNLPLEFSCVCLYDAESDKLTVTSVGGKSVELGEKMGLVQGAVIPIDQNGLSTCLRGKLVYEPDISDSAFALPKRLAAQGLHSLVISPLIVESNVFGVLVAARAKLGAFTSMDCEFLRQLSEHAALASHQARLYGALQQAYDDLRQSQQTVMQQERLRALGQMASGIAHDINNAISPVALYTDALLQKEPNLSERARDYLQTIAHAIEDVSATVARMREFYRRDPQMTLAPVPLNRAIQQVTDLTRARWHDMPQQKGIVINIRNDLDPNLPMVMGVEGEVREALTNLYFNAFDAMPEGGTLTLKTRAREDGSVILEVIDTGVGMDEETKRRCLEPFFTTKGERGTGLGLAMVYGVMQRHGASLELDSAPGKGTTARLVFPTSAAADMPAQPVFPLEALPRLRILAVDDDPLVLKSVKDILSLEGHIVVTANGGKQGIDAFREAVKNSNPFNAVITDLGMPYVDGRKVAATVKELSPSTPVILLTGWGQRLQIEGDLPPQVDRLVSKPPKLVDLREALVQVMMREAGPGPAVK